jgi:response regulator RpfG family c-di-GMP phosphodiesterase
MKSRETLTRRQLHVLPFLMINPTIETVSKQSGISAKQIFDWLNQPIFRQELERRKNEAVGQAVDRLKLTASKACDTLVNLLDSAQSDSIKHRVAVDMLNMTLKFMEFKDVEQRLRKLEETITS